MPVSRSGVTAPLGFNYDPDVMDTEVVYTLAASETLVQGQVLCRDMTAIPSATVGADPCVLPTSANAGAVMGVYQGAAITNPSSTATLQVVLKLRTWGYGVVFAGTNATPTRVTVGGNLGFTGPSGLKYATATTFTIGYQVGMALATGANTAAGANLTGASSTNTALVNAFINIQ